MESQADTLARQAVWRGAAFLDERLPDWWQRVNPATLRIESAFHCVLGQLYGTFLEGTWALRLEAGDGRRYGFLCQSRSTPTGGSSDEPSLNEAWRELVGRRR